MKIQPGISNPHNGGKARALSLRQNKVLQMRTSKEAEGLWEAIESYSLLKDVI